MHADFLFIVAEIAAAFAGFASLVAALSKRGNRSPEQERLDFLTLQNVLLLSLLAVAFALLPNLLERQNLSPAVAWRSSAAAFALGVGSYCAYILRQIPGRYRELRQKVPFSFRLNAGILLLCLVAQGFCAAGAAPLSAYLLGLSALLYNAGFGFVRLFVSLRPQSPAV